MRAISKGDTFWVKSSTYPFKPLYFHFVITESTDEGEVLIVYLRTLKDGADNSCILTQKDHPSIHNEMCVFYRRARLAPILKLERLIGGEECTRDKKASVQLIRKIQEGGIQSPHLSPNFKIILKSELSH